jgi:ubiquitin-small subunit ribosomal protein S27Ae
MAGDGKKKKKPHKYTPKYKYYKTEGGKVVRTLKSCPRCGPATFMAKHKDREYCGRCHYTVFTEKPAPKQ